MCIREHSNTNLMQKLNKVYSLCEILLFGIQDLAMIDQKAATKVREFLETTELNGFNEHLEKIQNMAIQIEGPDEGGQDDETADMETRHSSNECLPFAMSLSSMPCSIILFLRIVIRIINQVDQTATQSKAVAIRIYAIRVLATHMHSTPS